MFLSPSTINSAEQTPLCLEGRGGCRLHHGTLASLASTQQMPVASPSYSNQKCLQTLHISMRAGQHRLTSAQDSAAEEILRIPQVGSNPDEPRYEAGVGCPPPGLIPIRHTAWNFKTRICQETTEQQTQDS